MSRRRQPKLVVSSDAEETYEDSTECCAQYSLLAINLPLILFGVAFIVLGAWTLANRDKDKFIRRLRSQTKFPGCTIQSFSAWASSRNLGPNPSRSFALYAMAD